MGKFDGPSRCESGTPVKFRWYGSPQADEGRDIQVALHKFQIEIEKPHRKTNGYIWEMARAEIKKKLDLASQGRLRSPAQVKVVDAGNPPPLYEIRWQAITIQEFRPGGKLADTTLLVRMYHSEPFEAPNHFIGHHIHEKEVNDGAFVMQRQNEEIAVARGYFDHGLPSYWGISELTNSRKSIN